MKLSSRTYTVLDVPLSGTEFWGGIALCVAVAVLLLALPLFGRWGMALIGGWR